MVYLPPEILETIFSKINNNKTLLKLLLICDNWKNVIEYLPKWYKDVKEDYYVKLFKDYTSRQIYAISKIRNHFYFYHYIFTNGSECSLYPREGWCCHIIQNFYSTGDKNIIAPDQTAIMEHLHKECFGNKKYERIFNNYRTSWNTIIR
jgi:hypothetical protein